jgi:CheY-like chemotaxis protein
MPGRIHRLTAAGRAAWDTQDAKVPRDYRRILGLIETEAHSDVIRGYLRRYPDKLIAEWLAELEEMGLLESVPDQADHDLDFTTSLKLPALIAEDRERLDQDAKEAGASLSRKGVFLAADRLKNRVAAAKAPGDTVVLIVEDDPDQLALAELRVGMARYKVRSAASARALAAALAAGLPDLLLLDVNLPDGNGFDILAALRKHPKHALLPVVLLTVRSEAADVLKGLALGADGYVTKPYSRNVLAEVIGRVLGQAEPA